MAANITITSDIRRELEHIRVQAGGLLRPVDVVQYARNPDAALHNSFQWDDDKAADEYRLWQARQIIRVCVTVIAKDSPSVRAYVSLMDQRQEPGGGYMRMVDVLANEDYRAALLEEAHEDMNRFRQKYAILTELAAVFDAMKAATKSKRKKRRQS